MKKSLVCIEKRNQTHNMLRYICHFVNFGFFNTLISIEASGTEFNERENQSNVIYKVSPDMFQNTVIQYKSTNMIRT